jgi:4-hydroxybenzoate polyprenyltransferase/phosphoserine phosphatase
MNAAASPSANGSERAATGQTAAVDCPLVIDLDGTLLRSDLLLETALLHVRAQPWRAWQMLCWAARGKAGIKEALAHSTELDAATLPYHAEVLAMVRQARAAGRRLVLATASHRLLAEQVAAHLGSFDEVLATDQGRNLSGAAKRDALVERFGLRGFDYAGNSRDDLPVWGAARKAVVVNAPQPVERQARRLSHVEQVLHEPPGRLRDWARALRLHQWAKNLLLLVPLLASHRLMDPALLWQALQAFVAFGLCASSVYLLNDLLDLQDDRRHSRKRQRPFAAGRLPIGAGLLLMPLLLLAAFVLAVWRLPPGFVVCLALYYGLTLSYSLWLKRRMVIDVMALAALYTLRVIAGAMALAIAPSFWLLAISMFMFFSLALVKRFTELHCLQRADEATKAHGRGYYVNDLQMIAAMGAASGFMAVLVMALYINDASTTRMYAHQERLWFACPLLLTWIARVWMLTHRGAMVDDPVVFALRDRVSLAIGGLTVLVFWAAV